LALLLLCGHPALGQLGTRHLGYRLHQLDPRRVRGVNGHGMQQLPVDLRTKV